MVTNQFNFKNLGLIVIMGLGVFGAYSQCTINPTAIDAFTLDMDNPSGNGMSVAYNSDADLYYAVDGGSVSSNTLTFDATGAEVAAGINSGYDFRGVWWNPNTNQLEANAFSSTGIRQCDLDGSSYGLNTGTIILPSGQPDMQSQGDYDWDANEIIYYKSGSIHRYSRTTGDFIDSYPITGLPVPTSNLSLHTVGYTGCPGQEIMVYDMTLEAVYTIDKSTGAYANTCNMPGGITYPLNWYDISWANGYVFFRSGAIWNAYEVFPECQALTITSPETELCEGEEIVLTATSESGETVTWDMGVTDGIAFAPPVGTTTYTGSTIDELDCPYSINILVHPLPGVTATSSEDTICFGDDIILTGDGATTYTWDPAAITNGVPYTPTASGTSTYTVSGTDENGCVNSAMIEVHVYEEIVITFTTTDETSGGDGSIELSVSGGTPVYEYDWDNDGTGDFDDSEDLTDLTAGTYIIVVVDENGCTKTETITVDSQVGISEINTESVLIYPNPTQNNLSIVYTGEFRYELNHLNGTQIMTGFGNQMKKISLANLADGIYFITIYNGDSSATFKIVKK